MLYLDSFSGLLHMLQVKEGASGTQRLTPMVWPPAIDPSASGQGWALPALAAVYSPFLGRCLLFRQEIWLTKET